MAETYYCPHDLPRFAEMGKDRPELWAKFSPGTTRCSPRAR